MAVLPVAYGPSQTPGALGAQAFYRARAANFTGMNPLDPTIGEDWDDFTLATASNVVPRWQPSPSGSGVIVTAVTGSGGGIVRADTGVTGSSQMLMIGTVGVIFGVTSVAWYQAWRFRIPTTPDTQAKLLAGLFNQANNKTITVGVYGPLNASNFIAQYDGSLTGTALDLGVAKDTAMHVFELYGVGSAVLNVRFDGDAVQTATMASAPADFCMPIWGALNGSTAATQKIEPDYYYTMFKRV